MECIEPTQPQGKKILSQKTGLLCIFNLPVVSMEGQVNDHLVVAQYPLQAANFTAANGSKTILPGRRFSEGEADTYIPPLTKYYSQRNCSADLKMKRSFVCAVMCTEYCCSTAVVQR